MDNTLLPEVCFATWKQSFVVCPRGGYKTEAFGFHPSICPKCYDEWIRANVPTMEDAK